jgi:YD repeat-containing protein
MVVFAKSQSAFRGIYPSVRKSTATNVSPVDGQGVITDSYGGMWNYTYTGTVKTTTTTSSYLSLPYTDTTHTMYAYVYDQAGRLLSERRRMITTRQGGDGADTLGHNLGAALGAIHLKQGLLTDALKDVAR